MYIKFESTRVQNDAFKFSISVLEELLLEMVLSLEFFQSFLDIFVTFNRCILKLCFYCFPDRLKLQRIQIKLFYFDGVSKVWENMGGTRYVLSIMLHKQLSVFKSMASLNYRTYFEIKPSSPLDLTLVSFSSRPRKREELI